MISDTEMEIRFPASSDYEKRLLTNYELYFIVGGYAELQIDDIMFNMKDGDILLAEPGSMVLFTARASALAVRLRITPAFLQNYIPILTGSLVCNSITDEHHDYRQLKALTARLAYLSMQKEEATAVYTKAVQYLLLNDILTNHFERDFILPENTDPEMEDRARAILWYIHAHFKEEITLEDLADFLHLSSSYLSRIFSRIFRKSFYQFLNEYRVEYSVNDLLSSSLTVTEIAAKYGFPNTNAYINFFRKKYQNTPNAFRKSAGSNNPVCNTTAMENPPEKEQMENLLAFYANPSAPQGDTDLAVLHEQTCYARADLPDSFFPSWKAGINICHASNLIKENILNDLSHAQELTSFTYGRVAFFLNETFLSGNADGSINFFPFSHMINTLYAHHLIPYLDMKMDIFEPEQMILDSEVFRDTIHQIVIYSINTYGADSVENWIFDIGIMCNFQTGVIENPENFVRRFILAHREIRKYLPNARVGGFDWFSAMPLQPMVKILGLLSQKNISPDFISTSIVPYQYSGNPRTPVLSYSSDSSYALHYIRRLRQNLEHFKNSQGTNPAIYISMLSTNIMFRSWIYDTCYQSVFYAKNIIDLTGEADLICFFQLSDSNFTFYENQSLLDGRNGLFAQYGIPKPGALTLMLLDKMKGRLLAKGKNFMITMAPHDRYHILLCNYSVLKSEFCLNFREPLAPEGVYSVFEDPDGLSISITLDHVRDGTYQITSSHISRESGSLFDEWAKRDFTGYMNPEEIEYLTHIIYPKKSYSKRESTNQQLNFHIRIEPFETILVEAVRMVS